MFATDIINIRHEKWIIANTFSHGIISGIKRNWSGRLTCVNNLKSTPFEENTFLHQERE